MYRHRVSHTYRQSSQILARIIIIRTGSSQSSSRWIERQNRDIYVKKARYENYRARSAYKLIELNDKFKFLRPGLSVIECGAAPGAWTQVICDQLELGTQSERQDADGAPDQANSNVNNENGMCLAIDLKNFEPVDGAICLGGVDFCSPFSQAKLLSWLDGRKIDCLLSDMAPDATGIKAFDHETVMNLNKRLLRFGQQVLKEDVGVLLCKLWDGQLTYYFKDQLKANFGFVKAYKPPASRNESAELYLIAKKFKSTLSDQSNKA